MFISIHSICMNYCINAAWYGVDQSVALLRCNEAQVLLLICIVGSGVSHHRFSGVQVRWVCWPIKHNNTGHWTSFWDLWQCGQVPSPPGKLNQDLHEACQQKKAWSALKCPGRCLRWLWTSENSVDQHQQMTWQPKPSLTVKTSHWTSSNMDSVSLLSSSRLGDLDLQMKCNIYFNLKRGLWTTEQQFSSFSP